MKAFFSTEKMQTERSRTNLLLQQTPCVAQSLSYTAFSFTFENVTSFDLLHFCFDACLLHGHG